MDVTLPSGLKFRLSFFVLSLLLNAKPILAEVRALLGAVRTLRTANEEAIDVQKDFFESYHSTTASLSSRLVASLASEARQRDIVQRVFALLRESNDEELKQKIAADLKANITQKTMKRPRDSNLPFRGLSED